MKKKKKNEETNVTGASQGLIVLVMFNVQHKNITWENTLNEIDFRLSAFVFTTLVREMWT